MKVEQQIATPNSDNSANLGEDFPELEAISRLSQGTKRLYGEELREAQVVAYRLRMRGLGITTIAQLFGRTPAGIGKWIKAERERNKLQLERVDWQADAGELVRSLDEAAVMALTDFSAAAPGSIQRAAFLNAFVNIVSKKAKLLQDLGLLPAMTALSPAQLAETDGETTPLKDFLDTVGDKDAPEIRSAMLRALSAVGRMAAKAGRTPALPEESTK